MGRFKKKWRITAWTVVVLLLFFSAWLGVSTHRTKPVESTTGMDTDPAATQILSLPVPPTGGHNKPLSSEQNEKTTQTFTVTKKIFIPPVFQYQTHTTNGQGTRNLSDPASSPVARGEALTRERKKKAGIQKSLDLIIRSKESFTIGDHTISMQEILEKAAAKTHQVVEKEIDPSGRMVLVEDKPYGIHVVRPGENVWNIHFKILREYFAGHGARVSYTADEPLVCGKSSGVGKILKFSEHMVIIYNLVQRCMATDIHLLAPMGKIVVYNMQEMFALLQQIDYDHVDCIRFDGNAIWVPAQQP